MRDAITRGFSRFECDLLPTRDGEVVVAHGPTAGHGGGVPGELVIVDSSTAQLAAVRLPCGEGLPSLTALLELLASQTRTRAVLELKDSERGVERNRAFARAVVERVHAQGVAELVEYISFDYAILLEIRRVDPNARCAPLEHVHDVERYLADGMWGVDFDQEAHFCSAEEIAAFQRAGLTVNTWTVNERARLEQLVRWGIDFITTDEPGLLAELWAQAETTRSSPA